MEFVREKGVTELRGIAKSFGIRVGSFSRFNSTNKEVLKKQINEYLKMSDTEIALWMQPLRALRVLLRKSGVRGPTDLINIYKEEMIQTLIDVDFTKYNPEFVKNIERITELRECLMSETQKEKVSRKQKKESVCCERKNGDVCV